MQLTYLKKLPRIIFLSECSYPGNNIGAHNLPSTDYQYSPGSNRSLEICGWQDHGPEVDFPSALYSPADVEWTWHLGEEHKIKLN